MKEKTNILGLIDEMENVRKKNNKYWMDILRLAFTLDQKKTTDIVRKIHSCDRDIAKIWDDLSCGRKG